MTSPDPRTPAMASPTARDSSAEAVTNSRKAGMRVRRLEQSELLLEHGRHRHRLAQHRADRLEVLPEGGHLRTGLASPMQDGSRMEGGDHRSALNREPLAPYPADGD